MEMSVKFSSKEELLEFVSMFGGPVKGKGVEPVKAEIDGAKLAETVTKELVSSTGVEDKKVVKKSTPKKEEVKEEPKEEEKEEIKTEEPKEEVKEVAAAEKVTKEMVRAVFSDLIKKGKQKEAKELTSKYGASKLSEVKEEDFEAIIKEAKEQRS